MTTTTSTSTSSSSGILTSLGVGSGLDISTLVSTLTTAEMSAPNSRVTRDQTAVTTQVSALASLKSALSVFQSSLSALTTSSSSFDSRSVASSDQTVLTATGTSTAAVGSYDVTVTQLAKAQQMVSTVFADGASTVVGTGTLSLSLGNTSFDVAISSTINTLSGIRDAINSATNNPGISATIVYGTTGAQLLLTSSQTGAANSIVINQSGGDGGLRALVYNASTTDNYTVTQTAQDSIIQLAGVEHRAASNTVSDAIDGMTFKLLKAQNADDPAIMLTVSNDTAHVTSLVQSFVSAYNTLTASLSPLGSYDSSTKKAGAMLGDPLLSSIQKQISHALSDVVSGTGTVYTTLASLGITKGLDGTLTLDLTKLNTAMSNNFASVVNVLGGNTGVVSRVSLLLEKQLASSGSISARNTTLTDRQSRIDDEKSMIELRTAKVQERYLAKFNAMDTLLATLQSTSTYLTQQFDALNKSND